MATYSPMDSKVVLRVQTGTDSGGKAVLRRSCVMKVAASATADIVKAVSDGGIERADQVTPEQFAGLFATEDLQNAVRSFLADGPGKARFEGN